MTDVADWREPASDGDAGRKILLTGAAGRLGGWIAERFARSGDRVWLVDRDGEALKARAARIGPSVRFSTIDLTCSDQLHELTDAVAQTWGSPDVLINNAGIYPALALLDTDEEAWDRLLGVNLRAAHLLTRRIAKLMIARKTAGTVINVTSRSARTPRLDGAVYAVSKAGLEMLTRGYAMELAPYGIRVNAVSPGLIPGGKDSDLSDTYLAAARANIPLGRFSGADDAPAAIDFLCSDAAAFITGTTLFVDGGSSAGDFRLPRQNLATPTPKPESLP